MQHNILKIKINKPIDEVYEFTTNPTNTHKWIDSIVAEETNEWPIKLGSIYKNTDRQDVQNEYTVIELVPNQYFALKSKDGNYFVRYTYTILSKHITELEYHEWVFKGGLENPFQQETLEKLKSVIEQNS
jgi:uncharacterized protein YndB with AHSA1/START domain